MADLVVRGTEERTGNSTFQTNSFGAGGRRLIDGADVFRRLAGERNLYNIYLFIQAAQLDQQIHHIGTVYAGWRSHWCCYNAAPHL